VDPNHFPPYFNCRKKFHLQLESAAAESNFICQMKQRNLDLDQKAKDKDPDRTL
jgi:hypothetical protein